jgi:HlyD family secretion protein
MVVSVDELDIPKVEVGQQAEILVEALPDHTYTGKVTKIANEGTTNNGVAAFDVTILLDNAEGIKPGMSAEAKILVASKDDALYLPVEAVQSFRGEYFVLVPQTASGGEEEGGSPSARQISPPPGEKNGQEARNTPSAGGERQGQGEQVGQNRQTVAEQPTTATGKNAAPGASMESGERNITGTSPQAGERPGGGVRQSQGSAPGQGGGTGKRVVVEVGISNEDVIEIVSGLNEGDEVIVPAEATGQQSAQRTFTPGMVGFPGGGGGDRIMIPGGSGSTPGGRNYGGGRQP